MLPITLSTTYKIEGILEYLFINYILNIEYFYLKFQRTNLNCWTTQIRTETNSSKNCCADHYTIVQFNQRLQLDSNQQSSSPEAILLVNDNFILITSLTTIPVLNYTTDIVCGVYESRTHPTTVTKWRPTDKRILLMLIKSQRATHPANMWILNYNYLAMSYKLYPHTSTKVVLPLICSIDPVGRERFELPKT